MSTKSIWFSLCDKYIQVQGEKNITPPSQPLLKVKFNTPPAPFMSYREVCRYPMDKIGLCY